MARKLEGQNTLRHNPESHNTDNFNKNILSNNNNNNNNNNNSNDNGVIVVVAAAVVVFVFVFVFVFVEFVRHGLWICSLSWNMLRSENN